MFYKLAADAVVVLHLAFVVFVVAGGLLVFRWRWTAILHLPAVTWAVLLEFCGWLCPLTPLELTLREAGGETGYQGGFIEHYLLPIIYPDDLTRTLQIGMGAFVVIINIAIYACFLWQLNDRNRDKQP